MLQLLQRTGRFMEVQIAFLKLLEGLRGLKAVAESKVGV